MGEVVAGAVFVGAATSLPGAITSVTTAAAISAELAVGNALGGLTAQTAFIAVADLAYRRANLEHAAASITGLAQGVLLSCCSSCCCRSPSSRCRGADHLLGLYEAMRPGDRTTALVAILMTGVLVLGMIRRQREGVGMIGFESALVLLLYAASVGLVFY